MVWLVVAGLPELNFEVFKLFLLLLLLLLPLLPLLPCRMGIAFPLPKLATGGILGRVTVLA